MEKASVCEAGVLGGAGVWVEILLLVVLVVSFVVGESVRLSSGGDDGIQPVGQVQFLEFREEPLIICSSECVC